MATTKAPIRKKDLQQGFFIYLILVGSGLVTLAISPWNYDPVSVPKMTLLALIATLGLVAQLISRSNPIGFNTFDRILLFFIGLLLLNLFINSYAFTERFFGVNGRNTGFLTYVSFAAIAFLMSRNYRSIDAEKVLIALFLCNLVVMGYYLTQRAGIDFINITEYYSRPSSTLGNPNYVSGFLGFSSLAPILAYLIRRNKVLLFISLFTIPANIFVIWDSQSIQGIFSLAFSLFVLLGFLLRKHKLVFGIYLTGSLSLALVAVIGILGKGPLAIILNSSTLLSRYDYWRTATNMTISNPFFGVGLDGYGDFYRKYRDDIAFNRFGESLTTDTPHNVPFDFFASGGIPLGICFVFLVAIAYLKSAKRLFKTGDCDFGVLGLFTLLNAYLIQSLVSPNQIGVGIWLWVLIGALMGENVKESQKYGRALEKLDQLSSLRIISKFTSVTVLLISIPFLLGAQFKDTDFLSAARSTDGTKVLKNVESWPYDTKRFLLTATAFSGSELQQYSLRVARLGVSHNPNSYLLWRSIYQNPTTSEELKLQALVELKRLEPRYDQIASNS